MNMNSNEVRNAFIDYFKNNDHRHVKSGSLVPENDPSLMFANSGMVQFKNVFTGMEQLDFKRATTSQKCVRAGGKHNDLENVGFTTRHHTFFEMLGNFSFGDYFKEQAILYAWNLITKEFKINKDKLLVTIYHDDEVAEKFWKKIANLPDSKIIKISSSDNFWSMGDTGPCGPCSEIFYDHGDKYFGGPPGSVDEDGDRFIEIWNLVFMQYEQVDKNTRLDLPKPCVDTGMGLERITALLNGSNDNYSSDLFSNIIDVTQEFIQKKISEQNKSSFRVIADHLRASSFLIADGVLPSNEGRGYVLRRILRRGIRHAYTLGSSEPLFHKIFYELQNLMGDFFRELNTAAEAIKETLYNEEIKFRETLSKGLEILGQEIKAIAINEISIRREKYQAAKIQIMIDNEVRIEELVCDGVILSTAAGSTGYNYSASGPIIPLGSNVVALTAVSAYSPRHWRGGLLKDNAKIKIINNNPSKRPIVVHADHIEAKDVISVEIEMSEGMEIPLLFDNDHKIEERVYKEMFKSN